MNAIEKGYHFYNQQQKEFEEKSYPVDLQCAISYAAGVEAGKHQAKEIVAKTFKISHIDFNNGRS
jgi:hypothetical protein